MPTSDLEVVLEALATIEEIMRKHSYVGLDYAVVTLRSGAAIRALLGDDYSKFVFQEDKQYNSVRVGSMTVRWRTR